MQFAAALSEHPLATVAVGEVVGDILEHMAAEPDVLFVFATMAHAGVMEDIVPALAKLLNPKVMVGCLAEGVVGPEQEVLNSPGLVLMAVGGCDATAVRLNGLGDDFDDVSDAIRPNSSVVLLADRRGYDAEPFLENLNSRDEQVAVTGGYTAQRAAFGAGVLVLNGEIVNDRALAIVLTPTDLSRIDALVTQGARPIGAPLVVTKAEGKTIFELAGTTAMARLTEAIKAADEEMELNLGLEDSLLIGCVLDEAQEKFRVGDFAVRSLIDADHSSGSITVSDHIDVGAIVQFQVRDERVADLALVRSLSRTSGRAALMFLSTSRGFGMFDTPNHDVLAVDEYAGLNCVAGIITPGEFGPVAGLNVVNRLSVSMAVFATR